jgi:TetR/AcrR family transcriptional regulator, transcriptional repressor for nem operon
VCPGSRCSDWMARPKYDQDHIMLTVFIRHEPLSKRTSERKDMPYPVGHRDKIRTRIVHSARRLFNRNGFENVSVNQIMAAAGLTRGGFYKYFESKGDLYVEVLSCFFTDPNWNSTWEGIEVDLNAARVGPQVVRAYLSRQHFENIEDSCPMIALPSDVARGERKAKQAFEAVFDAMVRFLERDVRNRTHDPTTAAQAIAALCVGGMVVARALDDREVADKLREACMAVALKLGGWRESAGGSSV